MIIEGFALQMAEFRRVVLPNGMRVLLERRDDSSSAAVSLTVARGSRHEPPELSGITHFIEHMLFKGTRSRDVQQIAREINLQGGLMNAGTGYDNFRIYTSVVLDDLEAVIELIADMVWESTFPPAEVERERGVILEEIAEYLDSPEDLCYEKMLEKLWLPHPLGRPILGTPETVESFTRETLLDYWHGISHPSNIVVSIAGGINIEETLELIERHTPGSGNGLVADARETAGKGHPGRVVVARDLEQVQFCLGVEAISRNDPRRYTLGLLDTILGGGIGSRLFNEIREKRGLAYTIGSSTQMMLREGCLAIYGATSLGYLDEVLNVCGQEVAALCADGPTEQEMETAIRQYVRGLLLAQEINGYRSGVNADREIYGEPFNSVQQTVELIRANTADDVRNLAREIFSNHTMTVSLVGPVNETSDMPLTA